MHVALVKVVTMLSKSGSSTGTTMAPSASMRSRAARTDSHTRELVTRQRFGRRRVL
jgi:hypothetical protein